jgi:hypothetical protein
MSAHSERRIVGEAAAVQLRELFLDAATWTGVDVSSPGDPGKFIPCAAFEGEQASARVAGSSFQVIGVVLSAVLELEIADPVVLPALIFVVQHIAGRWWRIAR